MTMTAPHFVKQLFDFFPLIQLEPSYVGPAATAKATLMVLPDHAKSAALLALLRLLDMDLPIEQTSKQSHSTHPYLLVNGRVLNDRALREHVLKLAHVEATAPSLKSAGLALFAVLEDALILADAMDESMPIAWSSKDASFLSIGASQVSALATQIAKETPELKAIRDRYRSEEDTWTTLIVACQRNLEALEQLAPESLEDFEDKELAAMLIGYLGTLRNDKIMGPARKELRQLVQRFPSLQSRVDAYVNTTSKH